MVPSDTFCFPFHTSHLSPASFSTEYFLCVLTSPLSICRYADAKLNVIPVRRGYWGNKLGEPHTVPEKVSGKSGSVRVRLIPAPRGTGIVAAPVPKKLLQMAGVADCYTASCGSTRTLGNFVMATFQCIRLTYQFLTPDLWKEAAFIKAPAQEFSDFLAKSADKVGKSGKY